MRQQTGRQAGHFHAVQFYQDGASLAHLVAAFLAEGFASNDPAIIIATPEHRVAIEAALHSRAIDIDNLKRIGDLVVLDARETLAMFMRDGMPHAGAFQHAVGRVIRQACSAREGCTLRAYGEMVDVLWKDGMEAAAIRLETLWNELANSHDFKLLCGYSMGNFYKGAAIETIKGQHSHLTDDAGQHAPLQ